MLSEDCSPSNITVVPPNSRNSLLNFINFLWNSLQLLFSRLIPEFPNSRRFLAEIN